MTAQGSPTLSFRCGAAARWLPRVAAGTALLAAMLVAFRFDEWRASAAGFPIQGFLALVGGVAGLWILRSGAEVRVRIDLDSERITFAYGKQVGGVPLSKIDRFEFEHPMTASRRWLPATVLIDDQARGWRIPAVLESGAALIDAIIERTGREDLEAWADSLQLRRRMSRAGRVTAVGYGCSLVVVVAAIWFYFR